MATGGGKHRRDTAVKIEEIIEQNIFICMLCVLPNVFFLFLGMAFICLCLVLSNGSNACKPV